MLPFTFAALRFMKSLVPVFASNRIIFTAILLFPCLALTQSEVNDDTTILRLNKELASHLNEDTNKVKLLNDLGYYLVKSSPEKSKKKLGKAIKLAKELDFPSGLADSYNTLGILEKTEGNFDAAISYYFKSLKIYSNMKSPIGDYKGAVIKRNIGMTYTEQGNFKKADEYLQKSKKSFVEQSDSIWLIKVNNSLFNCHLKMADTITARKYIEEAKQIAIEMDNEYWQRIISLNMIVCQDPKHESPDILDAFKEGLKFFESIGSKRDVARTYFRIGYHYAIYTNNTSEAIKNLNLSLKLCNELNMQVDISKVHKVLYQLYADLGSYQKAFTHLKIVDSLDRVINDEAGKKIIAEIEQKYQAEKRSKEIVIQEKRIALLKKEKQQNERTIYGLIIGAGLFVLFLILLFAQYAQRKRSKEKEAQLRLKNSNNEIEILKLSINDRLNQPVVHDPLTLEHSKINSFLNDKLSEREFQVLVELKEGKSNKEIAESLNLSINTIKTYLLSLYVKLDVKNRTQAVQKAASISSE